VTLTVTVFCGGGGPLLADTATATSAPELAAAASDAAMMATVLRVTSV